MKNSLYTIYKHIFPNGKIYIGITQQDPKIRWAKGLGYKRNTLMWRAIKKYGWENIKHEILEVNLTEDEANKKEIELIEKFNTTDFNFGYNIRSGGLVCSGWKHTKEALKKMQIASSKPRNKPSSKIGKHYGRTKIYQYDLNGNLLEVFLGFWETGKALNIPRDNISDCANNHSKTCYGFTFSKNLLSKEEVIKKITPAPTKPPVTIYQYNKEGKLINTFIKYKDAVKNTGIKETTIEHCVEGRNKTAKGFVFSKVKLSKEEILKRYIKNYKKINLKYKIKLISKIDNKEYIFYGINEVAKFLNTNSTTILNILNKKSKMFSDKYIFIKENINENKGL